MTSTRYNSHLFITPPGRHSKATSFTSTGKVRITKPTFGSARTCSWQKEAYREAMETGFWANYLDDLERKYQERRLEDEDRTRLSPARRAWTGGA